MTEATPTPQAAVPKLSWWDRPKLLRGLLIASLALNVLVASAVATRLVRGERFERMPGVSQVQLLPRKFLRSLPAEKRKAARTILARLSDQQRGDRQWMKEISLQLADAITTEPYDVTKVKAVFAEYASRSNVSADRSGAVAIELLDLLTTEEKSALAAAIRERVAAGR